jgi:drug/metabolite transporter (DMT)-like permease
VPGAVGLGGAFLAALLYGVASVVQAVGVRRLTTVPSAASRLTRALAARWYALGLVLDGLGFLASLAALRTLPLFAAQTIVAASVGVTAFLAFAFLGARLTTAQVLALVSLAAGLVALGVSAPVESHGHLPRLGVWLLLGGLLPLTVLAIVAARSRPGGGFVVLALTAGLGFGGVAISARVLPLPRPLWRTLGEAPLWALAGYGVQSNVCYGAALSKGNVTVATALALAVETILPGSVGLAFLGDRVRPGFAVVALIGFLLALGGCLGLAGAQPAAQPATTGVGLRRRRR